MLVFERFRSSHSPSASPFLKAIFEFVNGKKRKDRKIDQVSFASLQARGSVINHLNGREGSGRTVNLPPARNRKSLSWMDAPDDVYFVATDATRSVNTCLLILALKRTNSKTSLSCLTAYFTSLMSAIVVSYFALVVSFSTFPKTVRAYRGVPVATA